MNKVLAMKERLFEMELIIDGKRKLRFVTHAKTKAEAETRAALYAKKVKDHALRTPPGGQSDGLYLHRYSAA